MAPPNITHLRVSAIIPTYNRFFHLMQAIESVKKQTHPNLEIIVVNDASTDNRYYSCHREGLVWVDLQRHTEETFGFACPGYVRNVGISRAEGKYIAFLDDDDMWLPDKITKQLVAMEAYGYEMSCTEALMGDSLYDSTKTYPLYNAEYYRGFYDTFLSRHFSPPLATLPDIFTLDLIKHHNCLITSSVVIKKTLLDSVGFHKDVPIGYEDWDLWKRCLEGSECIYLREPLVYYDGRLSANQQMATKVVRRLYRYKKRLLQLYKSMMAFH